MEGHHRLYTLRHSNNYTIKYKKSLEKDPKKRAKITRVIGNFWFCLFIITLALLLQREQSTEGNRQKNRASLTDSIAETKNKQSKEERSVFMDGFKESVRACVHKYYKAESVRGYEEMDAIGEKLFLKIPTKANVLGHLLDMEVSAKTYQRK